MKSFKEYYIQYLMESPETTGPLGYENKMDSEVEIINVKHSKHFNRVYDFPYYNVSLYEQREDGDIMVHFFDNGKNTTIGYVNYEEFDDGGCKIYSVLNRSDKIGLVFKVYTEYLLGSYNYIVSDGKHSPDAKKFWKTLITNSNNEQTVSVCSLNSLGGIDILKSIDTIDELDQFYGGPEFEKYLFMIANNNH